MRQERSKLIDPPDRRSPILEAEPTASQFRDKPGVLVVDDEHIVRIMLQLGLERNGFEVCLAANGREAIEVYQSHKDDIAVVLLDVQMPGLDGPHTLDALRELDPEVRACFMSGDGGVYQAGELRQQGAAYIAKPFLLDDLANILRLLAHGVPVDLLPAGEVGK